MRVLVNGEQKELVAIGKNGTEYTQDLLGNWNDLPEYDEEKDVYIMDQEAFDWWNEEIDKLAQVDELEETLDEESREEYEKESFQPSDLGCDTDMRLDWLREKLNK